MWPAPAWVGAMMSSRSGGVSSAPYDHMNLGDHVQDDPVAVARNRQILQEATGVRSVFLQQVHGVDAIALDEHSPETDRSLQADACYTQANGVACTIQVADCLPVLICHAHHRIVGAAHAGWRGLLRTFKQEAPYLARTLPQLPRLAHQQLAQPPRVDLQPQLTALIAAQNRQNRWLAVIALMLALLLGSRYL